MKSVTFRNVPNVHEHVAEETPDLCSMTGVVDQRALHEVRLVCLQDPLVEHDAVTHEHNDLQHNKHTHAAFRQLELRSSLNPLSAELI